MVGRKLGVAIAAAVLVVQFSASRAEAGLAVQTARAPVSENKVTLDLRVQGQPIDKIKVLSREGDKLAPVTGAVKAAPGAPTQAVIPADRPVMVRLAKPEAQKPDQLPQQPKEPSALLVESVKVPGSPNLRDIHQWSLVLYAQETPLPWDAQRHSYATQLVVGLKEVGDGAAVGPSQPVFVQLIGKSVGVDPPRIELKQSGVAGFQTVVVSLATHDGDGSITAVSDFGEESYAVKADPRLAELELMPTLTSIPGFGIGTTTISAVRRAEDRLDLLDPHALDVPLTVTGGRLARPALSFAANGARSNTVELRSAWLGQVTIEASANRVNAEVKTITFTPPWSYLAAILLGAGVGSYVRVRSRRKGLRSPDFAVGFGTGLILAAGSFVGVTSLVQISATAVVTEIGCFVIAALEAYAGRAALDRMTGSGTGADSSTRTPAVPSRR